jgi:LysR family hydrogen peroxide-inducible transcriptional activator
MDLKQIRYFVAVAEAGSFSAGARRAFVTQPTLSAAIASLEAELGFVLLERHARGVRLTPRGEEALETSRVILRQTERLKAASGGKLTGRPLRLGMLPTIAPAVVTECIGRLQALEPGRSWRTEDAPLAKLRERLASGRYDIILTALELATPGHRQLELATDRQALAVSARAFPRGPVSPEILAGQPLIVRVHCEQLQSASRILDAWKVRPRVVAQTDSDARALEMVAAGLGFCLMPDSFEHPGVRMLSSEDVELNRRLGLEWDKGGGDGWLDRALDRL